MDVVPLGYDIEAYNALSKSIELTEEQSEELQAKLAVVDKIMREVIEVELGIMKQISGSLEEYLTLNLESRRWSDLTNKIQHAFSKDKESQLKNLEQVFEARRWCVQNGRVMPLTGELKEKLRNDLSQAFEEAKRRHESILSNEITTNDNIQTCIKNIGKTIEDLNRLNEHQFNTKTWLTMMVHEVRKEEQSLADARAQLQKGDETSLEAICRQGDIEHLKADIDKFRFKYNKKNFVNKVISGTPLIVTAAIYGQHEIAACLLENGANVEACDKYGYQAIHYAAKFGNFQLAVLLLRNKPSIVDAKGEYGRTPLHMAAFNGWELLVKLLLEKGANPNICTKEDGQKTPLHDAVMQNKIKVVEELLERKNLGGNPLCDVNLRDQANRTPLKIVVEYGLVKMFPLIIPYHNVNDSNDPNSFTKLYELAPKANGDRIRELLSVLIKRPLNLNKENAYGTIL